MLIDDFLSVLFSLRTTFARREMLCVTVACDDGVWSLNVLFLRVNLRLIIFTTTTCHR